MIYFEYEYLLRKYREAQGRYDEILAEKEEIFERTQPKAIRYDRDKVTGGVPPDKNADYMIQSERKRIDERLQEVKNLLAERKYLLELKERDLRESKDIYDKVYTMRYLDHIRIYKIAGACHYSEAQIYRILHEICENLKDDRK